MKRHIGLGILVLLAAPLAAAEKEDVAGAAKQLADKENYSWKTTTESPQGGTSRFRPGPSEGKTEKGGYTTLKFTFGENTVEAVLKGDKGAIKSEEGWQSLAEAAQGEGQQNRARFFARMLQNQRTPAAQAADLASKTKELKKADDAIAGELTEQGAKDLLTFRRRGGDDTAGPESSGAKGTVKFWIKDGVLTKYQYHVQGTVKFNDQEREVDRTTTVEIKDVGKTKVEVPDEAKSKSS